MRKRAVPVAILCCSAAMFFLIGCGQKGPYYTVEGMREARIVVIHHPDGKTEKIPVGTGMGAGLTEEHRAALSSGNNAVVEKGKAKVTVTAKGPLGAVVLVKKVEYDGKEIPLH